MLTNNFGDSHCIVGKLSVIAAFAVAICGIGKAQSVKTITSFTSSTGQNPALVLLTQGRDGNLYGTTARGGANGMGTIFRQRVAGSGIVALHDFSGPEGASPQGGLTLGRDGNYYGSAVSGGTFGYGVLFKITSGGTLTVTLRIAIIPFGC